MKIRGFFTFTPKWKSKVTALVAQQFGDEHPIYSKLQVKKHPVGKADVRIIRRRAMVEELYGAPFRSYKNRISRNL